MGCARHPYDLEGSLRLADGGGWFLCEDGGGSRCDGWEEACSSTSGALSPLAGPRWTLPVLLLLLAVLALRPERVNTMAAGEG